MTTIRDVARLAGVSISTVSLALNSPKRVGAETLDRIQQAIKSTGYRIDPVAQTLARGRSSLIGFVSANLGNMFFGDIRREIEHQALDHGYFVLIADSSGRADLERALLERLEAQKIAGIALAANGRGEEYATFLRDFKTPIVMFDQKVEGAERDFVGSDNPLTTIILTEHLLQLGHRRIGFISGPSGLHTADERLKGFMNTMAGAGVDVDPSLVVEGGYTRTGGHAQAMRLLTRRDRPTAIIGANNMTGLAALQVMQEMGFRCPDDVSLAMVDDVPWSNVITPRITMVVQDAQKLGELAAQRLLARIASPEGAAAPPQDFILTPRFVRGESTRRL
ncbi:LacI family transcriptional regulator [Rhizobium leguminosarum]|uniref:LacI family DNA-binding transcriptional regulator n=1 Tax=Rhizobium leguminosarum TaxID=384 RepID=UPI001C9898B3|nr:LacI family DNA-binding transcriptional regulator [Rhizobium leguminosarum]MBY5568965.1 LacI family transcriptional regulator [Rhizobium leguminosarum]MBY5576088.1 LacI family transcriptional regulator [Rhizobium leguminosarum]